MFEDVLTAAETAANPAAGLDAAVIWHRMESAACARKLAYAAAVLERHLNSGLPIGTLPGGVDPADAAEGEIAAALGVTVSTAGRWMWLGYALATRLPNLAALFANGEVIEHQVNIIALDTANVDAELIKEVERKVLDAIRQSRTRLVGKKLHAAVNHAIVSTDPDGLRKRREQAEKDRHVHVHTAADGMTELSGSLRAQDGIFLTNRLAEMAKRVCREDPRSFAARRADALIALAQGKADLDCLCGSRDCPYTAGVGGTVRRPLVHVITTAETLKSAGDAVGWIDGYGCIDAAHVQELAKSAIIRELAEPQATQDQYRPTRGLADWVRAFHGWCAFPGCDQPAWETDLDHRTPYREGGETTAKNMGPFCRRHHNLHTRGGWETQQSPDGTLTLTDPNGRAYIVEANGPIPLLTDDTRRKRPRAKQRADRIRRERHRMHVENAQPPPF